MNIIKRIYRLCKNLAVFLAELSRHDSFYWRSNSCQTIGCQIDETVQLYGSYRLMNVAIEFASYVSHNAQISNTKIGKFCSIGPNLVCGWGIHPTNGMSTHPAFYSTIKKSKVTYCHKDQALEYKPIIIGNDVFIGANVTILDGITIGDGAVIGAGSVVSKDIPPYAIAVGCPIKIIRYRFADEMIQHLNKIRWWDKSDLYEYVEDNFYDVSKFVSKESNVNII